MEVVGYDRPAEVAPLIAAQPRAPVVVEISNPAPVVVGRPPAPPVVVTVEQPRLQTVEPGDAALAVEQRARIASDEALRAEIAALEAQAGVTPDNLAGAIAGVSNAAHALFATAEAAIADARAEANAAALAARVAIDDARALARESNGEIDTFVAAARAHLDLSVALRATAAVAADMSRTQTIVADTRAAQVTIQQEGLARIGEVGAAFGDFRTALVANNVATADAISGLLTQTATTQASVESIAAAMAAADAAMAARSDVTAAALQAQAGEVATFLAAARDGDLAAAQSRSANAAMAGVARIEAAQVDAQSAMASIATTVAARHGEAMAAVTAESMARADAIAATALDVAGLTARMGAAEGQIVDERLARSDADAALAARSDVTAAALDASSAEVAAFLAAARDGDLAAAQSRSANAAMAGVAQISVAIADAQRAMATLQTTIAARYADAMIAVTQEAGARVAADGAMAAYWGVQIDANGRIVGRVRLDGTGATSVFSVLADAFRVSSPAAPDVALLEVGAVNGAPAIVLRAPLIADNAIVNDKLAQNAVSHQAISKGVSTRTIALDVRAGATVMIVATYEGGDASVYGAVGALTISVNGTQIDSQAIRSVQAGMEPSGDTMIALYERAAATLLTTTTPAGAGTLSITATTSFSTAQKIALYAIEMAA